MILALKLINCFIDYMLFGKISSNDNLDTKQHKK